MVEALRYRAELCYVHSQHVRPLQAHLEAARQHPRRPRVLARRAVGSVERALRQGPRCQGRALRRDVPAGRMHGQRRDDVKAPDVACRRRRGLDPQVERAAPAAVVELPVAVRCVLREDADELRIHAGDVGRAADGAAAVWR